MKKLIIHPIIISVFLLSTLLINGCGDDDSIVTVSNVAIKTINPESPTTLFFEDRVEIQYDYEIFEPEGARIWIMPYTDGDISPKYSYTSSPLFKGKGSKDVVVTVNSGDTTKVDQLRVVIANFDASETISESFVSVDYTFVSPTNQVAVTSFNPESPATLASGTDLKLNYSYNLLNVSSVKLDVDLLFEDNLVAAAKVIAPLFLSGGAPHQGNGGVTFQVAASDEDVKIDQIRFFAKDNGTGDIFYESFIDVDYTFSK